MAMPVNIVAPDAKAALFAALLERYAVLQQHELQNRWLILQAAHVVGQTQFMPHIRVHCLMLALGWETRDWPEMAGQLFRIALVPFGHLLGRLPLGNPGRANVSAFKTMPVSPDVLQLIASVRNT